MWHPPIGSRVAAVLLLLVVPACAVTQELPSPAATPGSASPPATADIATVAPSASQRAGADPFDARVIATLTLEGGPDHPTEAFGSLWVLAVDGPLRNDGTVPAVHRIDPATNKVVASVELPGRLCQGIGASPDAIWACGPDGLVRIDPHENAIVATVELPAALVVSRIAYGAGSVWAFATSGVAPDRVVRIDPATNAVTTTIDLGHAAGTMAFGFDALWVTSPTDDQLLRIDAATNGVEEWATIESAGLVAVGESALWVSLFGEEGLRAEEGEPTIVRIDPQTGSVAASIATGGSLDISGGMVAADDGIWVRADDPFLVRIDPDTNEVVERLDAAKGWGDVTVAFGSVWATVENGEVIRLDPED